MKLRKKVFPFAPEKKIVLIIYSIYEWKETEHLYTKQKVNLWLEW